MKNNEMNPIISLYSRDIFILNSVKSYFDRIEDYFSQKVEIHVCDSTEKIVYEPSLNLIEIDSYEDDFKWMSRGNLLDTPTLVITRSSDVNFHFQLVKLGVRGVWSFQSSLASLASVAKEVAHGGVVVSPQLTSILVEKSVADRRFFSLSKGKNPSLSAREIEVALLLCEGYTNVQIAHRVGITERTVKYHVSNICDKIHAVSRTHAAALLASGFLGSELFVDTGKKCT